MKARKGKNSPLDGKRAHFPNISSVGRSRTISSRDRYIEHVFVVCTQPCTCIFLYHHFQISRIKNMLLLEFIFVPFVQSEYNLAILK